MCCIYSLTRTFTRMQRQDVFRKINARRLLWSPACIKLPAPLHVKDDEDKPLRVETTTDSGCLTHVSALPQPKKKKSNHSLRDSRTGGTYPSILSSRWHEGAVEIHDSLNWFHVGADWGGHQDKAQAKQVRRGYSNKRRLTLTFVWVHPCAEVT